VLPHHPGARVRQVRLVQHVEEQRSAAECGVVAHNDLVVGAKAVARGLLERVGATRQYGEI